MRIDPGTIAVFFAQASDAITPNSWPVALVALLGTGGLGALIGPYLKARADRERQAAEEESSLRRAKHDAELAQIHVVTSLAQSVPATLEKLASEIQNDRDVLVREFRADREMVRDEIRAGFAQMRDVMVATSRTVDSNTQAVDALTGHLVSEDRDLIRATAEKVGAETNKRALDDGPRSTGVRPRLASSPR